MMMFYRDEYDLVSGRDIVSNMDKTLRDYPHLDTCKAIGKCTDNADIEEFKRVKAATDKAFLDDNTLFSVEAFRRTFGSNYDYTLDCAKRFIRAYLPHMTNEYNLKIESFEQKGREEIASKALSKWYEQNKTNPLIHVVLDSDKTRFNNPYTLRNAVEYKSFHYFANNGHYYIQACCDEAGKEALEATNGFIEAAKLKAELDNIHHKLESNNIFEVLSIRNNAGDWCWRLRSSDYTKQDEYLKFNVTELRNLIFAWNDVKKEHDARIKAEQLLKQKNDNSLI